MEPERASSVCSAFATAGRSPSARIEFLHPALTLVDEGGVVIGRLGRSALRADQGLGVEEAMAPAPSTVRPSARLDAMVKRMRDRDLTSLPVTASDGRLLGLLMRADAERALARAGSS